MSNIYNRLILPGLLDSEMGSPELIETRKVIAGFASGVTLEIGFGSGHNLPFYKNITKLYALDPSQGSLDIARSRMKGINFPVDFICKSAEHIPLPDNSVDTVVSTWALCSVRRPKKVLSEIARVLRPGGVFAFTEHGASPRFFIRVIQWMFTNVSKYFTGNCHYDRRIDALIQGEKGFTIQKMEYPPEEGRPLIYNYEGFATATGKDI